jgi:hypothetical protein
MITHVGNSGRSRAWLGLLGRRPDWEQDHPGQRVSGPVTIIILSETPSAGSRVGESRVTWGHRHLIVAQHRGMVHVACRARLRRSGSVAEQGNQQDLLQMRSKGTTWTRHPTEDGDNSLRNHPGRRRGAVGL